MMVTNAAVGVVCVRHCTFVADEYYRQFGSRDSLSHKGFKRELYSSNKTKTEFYEYNLESDVLSAPQCR